MRTKIQNKGQRRPPRDEYLTRDEVQRMLDCCGAGREHIELFLLISTATGARKEAVLNLTWDQVHVGALKGGVQQSGKHVEGTWMDFGAGSGNKRRPKISIPDNMRLWTLLTMPRVHPEYVVTYRGQPITDVKKGFREFLAEAKIKKKVTPHSMKHKAITLMLQRGIDPEGRVPRLAQDKWQTRLQRLSRSSPELPFSTIP